MTARSVALRLTQPALREPCARGSSGQQDKAPVERVHLRQVSRPLKASKGQGYHISHLVIGALLLALAGDASAAMTMRDKSDKAKVLPIGFDHPNGPAKIFKSNSNPSL